MTQTLPTAAAAPLTPSDARINVTSSDPHPTLTRLSQTYLGGNLFALVTLLDALDTGTLRQARIERHHSRPARAHRAP